ncbi:hypothetical protein DFH09DRAFT_1226445 [Mycena vulgaris]|nr:hypothetical protein DFH09DRAFT_1226445 [Mycena vulgaris]
MVKSLHHISSLVYALPTSAAATAGIAALFCTPPSSRLPRLGIDIRVFWCCPLRATLRSGASSCSLAREAGGCNAGASRHLVRLHHLLAFPLGIVTKF